MCRRSGLGSCDSVLTRSGATAFVHLDTTRRAAGLAREKKGSVVVATEKRVELLEQKPVMVTFRGICDLICDSQFATICIYYAADDNEILPLDVTPKTTFVRLPLSIFSSEAQLREWYAAVYLDFQTKWHPVMVNETQNHFQDSVNYHLGKMGIVPINFDLVIRDRQGRVARDLKGRFELPEGDRGRGRFSKWSEAELLTEVRGVLNTLPPGQRRYSPVNNKLKELHPERAPKNGEALRKLLGSFGYTLQKVKAGKTGE